MPTDPLRDDDPTCQRLLHLFHKVPALLLVADTRGRITQVNDTCLQRLGMAREHLLGRRLTALLDRRERRRLQRHTLPLLLKLGQLQQQALRLTLPRGGELRLRWSAALDQDGDDRPAQWLLVLEDETLRCQAEQALQQATEHVRLATESGGIGLWAWDVEADEFTLDTRVRQLYGRDQPGSPSVLDLWRDQVHLDDRAALSLAVRRALRAGGEPLDAEYRVHHPDGSVHHLRVSGRLRAIDTSPHPPGEAPAPRHLVGACWDVTESRQLAAELAEQHELLRVTLQSIGDAVITTDAAGRVSWLNPVAERMTGWPLAEAQARPLAQVLRLLHQHSRTPLTNPVDACLAQRQAISGRHHTLLLARDGHEYGIEDTASPIRNSRGQVLGVVLVFRDVTEQRRLAAQMQHRATHDALTGLANRSEFETRLKRVLADAHEHGHVHALLYVDLDQFKLVNDSCGHAAGDLLLQQVARLLGESVRSRDTLARLGGDEFGLILEHCPPAQAQRVGQQLCERMEQYRYVHEGRRFRVGTSIGLVPVDSRWPGTAAILQAADAACYAAKEAGRNRVQVWHDSDQTLHARHGEMQWASRLTQALDEGRFELHAQRIVALGGPSSSGAPSNPPSRRAEVLLRLVDEDGQRVLPGAFLPAAERFQLATRIDRWVLQQVLERLRALPLAQLPDGLCVNLCSASVGDRSFHDWTAGQLELAGPEVCHRLCLEISEAAAVTHVADAEAFIRQVRAVGVRVALDDFGAGTSSFGYLKTLAVDCLKIDGQFVRQLTRDPLDEAAVRCFTDVARVLGLQTVAEFVDRPELLDRLRALGVQHAQGFALHQPEPLDLLLQVFEDERVAAAEAATAATSAASANATSAAGAVHATPFSADQAA